ncbi:MAG: hypothetical protein ACK2U2_10060 [Anaerolineae bacterium]|jgi:hypothetical protein
MNPRRRKRLASIALFLLLTALCAVLLYGVMHEALAPWLARAYGTIRTYYRTIPQPVLWMVFIGVGVLIAVRSLLPNERWSPEEEMLPVSRGRVQTLRLWIRQAATEIYFDRRLARHLGSLALEIQSHTSGHKVAPGPMKQRLEGLDLPPQIREYLKTGLDPMTTSKPEREGLPWPARLPWPANLFRSPETHPAPDVDLEEIVRLLENQLEGRHDTD